MMKSRIMHSPELWQFADFYAIHRELTDNFGFEGTAWNFFPYHKYFKTESEGNHKDEKESRNDPAKGHYYAAGGDR